MPRWSRLNESERCYLAGFFDGEGSICVTKSSGGSLRVSMNNTDIGMLRRFRAAFGGGIYSGVKTGRFSKDWWHWGVSGREAVDACRALASYLRGKRRQAEYGSRWEMAIGRLSPTQKRRRAKLARRIAVLNGSWRTRNSEVA